MPARKSPQVVPCAIEALEPRTHLASTTAHVTVFNDVNLNSRRDAGEPPVPGYRVAARITDRLGRSRIYSANTDAAGRASITSYTSVATVAPFFVVPAGTAHWVMSGHNTFVFQNGQQVAIGVSDRGPVSGSVHNVIAYPNGTTSKVPLSGRRVFEDLNANGRFDRGEPSGVTNEQGVYRVTLTAGAHTLRVQPRAGWKPAATGSDVIQVVASPSARPLATMTVQMHRPTVIDVLAVYTPNARGTLTTSRMKSRVGELFAFANAVYGNSDTGVLLNPVSIAATTYAESGTLRTDLERLKNPRDQFMDDVHGLRNATRADLTVLLTNKANTPGEEVGVGYQYHAHPQQSTVGFSAVALTGNKEHDWLTLAHEIGHNLGAGHEAGVDDSPPSAAYAQGFRSSHATFGGFKDVMSHGSGTMLPFFSSPRVETHFGAILGNAQSADNARMIREVAPVVAKYR